METPLVFRGALGRPLLRDLGPSSGSNVVSKTAECGSTPHGPAEGSCPWAALLVRNEWVGFDSPGSTGVCGRPLRWLAVSASGSVTRHLHYGLVREDAALPCKQSSRVRLPAGPLLT